MLGIEMCLAQISLRTGFCYRSLDRQLSGPGSLDRDNTGLPRGSTSMGV